MQRVRGYTGNERAYLQVQFELSNETIQTTRKLYDLIDVLALTGGLAYFLVSFFGIALAPWARYQYLLKAIQKLYWAKTKSNLMFLGTSK